jgi:hypothetical protein
MVVSDLQLGHLIGVSRYLRELNSIASNIRPMAVAQALHIAAGLNRRDILARDTISFV